MPTLKWDYLKWLWQNLKRSKSKMFCLLGASFVSMLISTVP